MVDTVTRRIIELDVKTSGEALRAMKAQQESLKQVEKSIQSAQDAVKQFAIGFAAAFSVGAVVENIKATITAMDQAADSAQALGVSVKTLSEWSYAASMSGSNAEELSAGIRGLSKTMAEFEGKGTKATKVLTEFGVKAGDDVDTALTKIAEGFSKLPDGLNKTALAMDVFGKSGAKLIPMLNEGAEGIEALKQEANDLGIVLDSGSSAAAQAFGDNLDKINEKVQGLTIQLAKGLLPALVSISEEWARVSERGSAFRSIGEYIGEVLVRLNAAFIGAGASILAAGQALYGLVKAGDQFLAKDFKGAADTLKKAWDLAGTTLDEAGKKIVRIRDNLESLPNQMAGKPFLDSIDKFLAGPEAKTPTGGGGTAKVDKDVQALERFIKTTREAALAVNELTTAQQLEYQVASGQIKVTTEKEQALLAEARAAAGLADIKKRQSAEEAADLARAKEEQQAAEQALKLLNQTRQAFEDMADPTLAITRQMESLDAVIEKTFDEESLARLQKARLMLRQDFTAALMFGNNAAKDLNDSLKSLGETLQQEIEGYSKNAADALVEFASTGKSSVRDMVTSILSDLAKLAVKKQLDPVFADFGKWVGSFAASAKGNVFGPGGVQAFASGGVVSGPTFFGMSGGGTGLMGEAGPEAVVPLKRTASGDLGVQASPVNVTVINNAGADIKTEESKGPMGEQQIRILVNNAVEEGIGRGRFDRVMSTTYGVSRRGR